MARETVRVLKLSLHGVTVGYLAGYQHGRNILVFDSAYVESTNRPTFTLTGLHSHPAGAALYRKPWSRQQRLHPVLSNLLPEGVLRDWMAQSLKVHPENEFPLFMELGSDLPGALQAEALAPNAIPAGVLDHRTTVEVMPQQALGGGVHFSLAGVQMKFSMKEGDKRFLMSRQDQQGDWIIKTPSMRHKAVPLNEYTSMQLAAIVGVDVPEVRLVPMAQLSGLPPLNLPDEQQAYAIKRFDRNGGARVHTEDFAQVLFKYPHEKYGTANFEQLAHIVYEYTGHGLANVQQMARRLLVNVLLANGDAHLKNWSLIYADAVTAELAPAYDIVYTQAYIPHEQDISLNMGSNKNWYAMSMAHFKSWTEKAGLPWRAITPHLQEVMELARSRWPDYLRDASMLEEHKLQLRAHWARLHQDFRIL